MLLARHIRLGALTMLLICLIALGLTVGCSGSGEQGEGNGGAVPSSPEEADNVVVRVSGTEGTAYLGNYGTFAQEPKTAEGTVGDEPVEYAVEVEKGASEGVSAYFQNLLL